MDDRERAFHHGLPKAECPCIVILAAGASAAVSHGLRCWNLGRRGPASWRCYGGPQRGFNSDKLLSSLCDYLVLCWYLTASPRFLSKLYSWVECIDGGSTNHLPLFVMQCILIQIQCPTSNNRTEGHKHPRRCLGWLLLEKLVQSHLLSTD